MIFGYGRLFCRGMLVDDRESFRSISRNGNCVSFRAGNFANGIDNRNTFIHLIQFFPGIGPVSIAVQSDRITDSSSICIQLNLYAVRPDTILVISVIPDLVYRDVDLSWMIAVRNIITRF